VVILHHRPGGLARRQHIAADKDSSPSLPRPWPCPASARIPTRGSVMVGFARNTVMSVAGKVIEAVKGKLSVTSSW